MFSSTWGVGHVFPMVPLARAFLVSGHDVRWVTNEQACHLVRAAGLDVRPGGWDRAAVADAERRMRAETARLPGRERAAVVFPALFGHGATPAMVTDLLSAGRDWRPDLMIHEPAEHAAALVAAILDVPCLTHSWGGAIPAGILQAAGRQLADLWAAHGLTVPDYAGAVTSTYLDLCPAVVQPVDIGHIPVRRPLRPMLYSGETPAEPSWSGDGGPLVYVTMGTIHNRSPAMAAAVGGVAAAARSAGCRALVVVGTDGDPAALGPQPSGIVVRNWVSQSAVLPHAALVVSHAGSGTSLGAWGYGVPHLCLPQAADQFRNAEAAVRSGSGLALEPAEATPDTIEAAVGRLLTDDTFRAAAESVSGQIAKMPMPDEVAAVLTGSATG